MMKTKKVVLAMELGDEKQKQKAFKAMSDLPGIDKLGVDMERKEMTILGTLDPVAAVVKLRKLFPDTDIVSVNPVVHGNRRLQHEEQEYLPPVFVGHGGKDNPNANLICWPSTRHSNAITY